MVEFEGHHRGRGSLGARVRLSSAPGDSTVRYSFENFTLDTARRELRRGSALIAIQPQVFDLLEYLMRNRERVISKDDLIATVWNGRIVSESTLSTRINAARSAIGDNGQEQRLIRTTSRKGIRFVSIVREEADAVAIIGKVAPEPGSPSAPPLPDKPSIAVLPFQNISGDPEQEYFADGMV
jgi:adenylate cyclase